MEFVLFGISFRAEQWKLSRRKSSAVTLSLSLSSFHLFSLFYLCCSICSFFSFFYYLSLHPWISILLFIASAAYMHINDESSNRTDRRARRIHFRFVSTRVIIRGEKWEKHLTIVHRVESRGRLMRTRVKNDFPPSFFFFLTRSGKVNLTCKWNRFLLLFFSRVWRRFDFIGYYYFQFLIID